MRSAEHVEIAVIGAGIVGIATAHALAVRHKQSRLVILDEAQPLALTSAQSGENYRNWWPHPVMTGLTDMSIGLLEDFARATANRIHMTRRGYLLATRDARPSSLIEQLHQGYGATAAGAIRIHETVSAPTYAPPASASWETAPGGVDVLAHQALIRRHYPTLDPDVRTILHIRRAGDISGQQLGQHMLEEIRAAGGRLMQARVVGIEPGAGGAGFDLALEAGAERGTLRAERIVNAAGPYAGHVARLHGEALALANVRQQKIAFADRERAIPREMPFAIDLDGQRLPWTVEEREALASDPAHAALLAPMPGGIHCRPDGGDKGTWIKLGWAYNSAAGEPSREPPLEAHFPDIVLRAASRLQPRLKAYLGALPRERTHYGGYYTMTAENWPLIGPAKTPGVFLAAALSGYGTMASCAAGELCARTMVGAPLPDFARALSLARYDDKALMGELTAASSRGVL